MELNDEQFWQALRQALKAAEADEAAEMSAAERLLAETPVDDGAALSDARIDEVVRFATTPTVAEREAEDLDDAHAPSAHGHAEPLAIVAGAAAKRPSWKLRLLSALPRPLAAAAALLLSVQFLAAAVVVTTVVVTAVVLQNTTQTLEYQDAVRLMMQDEQSELTRRSSQAVVFDHVLTSIEIVNAAAAEQSTFAEIALRVKAEIQQAVNQPPSYSPLHFTDDHRALGDVVANASLGQPDREAALQSLKEQVLHGVAALAEVQQQGHAPAILKQYSAMQLSELQRMLSQ